MDRETWASILQLAVVAPYLYYISEKQPTYFKLGLKLVAAGIVMKTLPPLLEQVQPLIATVQKMQQEKDATAKAEAIEGEFSTVDNTPV